MHQDIPTIISLQIWGHHTQDRWESLMDMDHLDLTLTVIEGLMLELIASSLKVDLCYII